MMAKNRSLNKIGKEFDDLVADMKKTATEWAKASGAKKQTLLMKMKQMTKEKKELQAEMERAVMDVDKDATLQVDERYQKIALASAIGRLVEKELNILTPTRSTRRLLERKLNENAKLFEQHATSFIGVIKRTITEDQWNNFKQFMLPATGLNEAGNMSDDDIADAIAQISKEVTKGKVEIDPDTINVDAIENPNSSDDEIVEEAFKIHLTEGLVIAAIMAAPTIIKLLSKLVNWITGFTKNAEQRAVSRILNRVAHIADKKDEIPPKKDLPALLGGVGKGIFQGVSFKNDEKYIDAAYEHLAKEVAKSNKEAHDGPSTARGKLGKMIGKVTDPITNRLTGKGKDGEHHHDAKFDPNATEPQPADDHMKHILHEASMMGEAGKWLGEIAHSLHTLFLQPFQFVVAGVIWVSSKAIGKKVAWKDAYTQAKKAAEILYTVIMLFFSIQGGITSIQELIEKSPKVGNVLSSVEGLEKIGTIAIKAAKSGDLAIDGIRTALAAGGVM